MASEAPNSEFSAFHMKCINMFRWTALSRSVIQGNSVDGYSVKPSPFLAQLVFFIYFANTMAKQVFLALLITDHLGPIEFLDRICGLDYFLCGTMVCIAYTIWQRYPLYEVIHRLWEIENRIYQRLGKPREIKWKAEEQHSVTVWAHAVLAFFGCCSMTIQFYMAPKYCVFTYSLIEMDNEFLRVLFCFHEALFLSHAWSAMACSNGLCSFEAVNLSLVINEMGKTVEDLANVQGLEAGRFFTADVVGEVDGNENGMKFHYNDEKRSYPTTPAETETASQQDVIEKSESFRPFSDRQQNQRKSARNSTQFKGNYDFKMILYDYQQLMVASEVFNAWIGYKIVGLSICAFCQYISSTCMAFQVLRMPGTGISDIWFYIQDCTVAVYVTFRVFDFMSIVLPASQNFLSSVRNYMASQRVVKGHIRKFQKTLRPVSLKLGPNPLRREAVLDTMEMLSNYYVCVALW